MISLLSAGVSPRQGIQNGLSAMARAMSPIQRRPL